MEHIVSSAKITTTIMVIADKSRKPMIDIEVGFSHIVVMDHRENLWDSPHVIEKVLGFWSVIVRAIPQQAFNHSDQPLSDSVPDDEC